MAAFEIRTWPSRGGLLAVHSATPAGPPERPVVAILHGALRRAEVLYRWADLLADVADTVLVDLPGHGRSDGSGPASIAGMAEAVGEVLDAALVGREVLLVGESLGGTVALAVAGRPGSSPVRAVLAADPPMTTAKLWNLAAVFRGAMGKTAEPGFVDRLGHETFGLTPQGSEERIYYPLLGALRVPAVIVTGDVPLLPPRQMRGVACLFDAVDRFVVATHYAGRAEVRQVAGCGHVLLVEAEATCRAIVGELLARRDLFSGAALRGGSGPL